MSGTQLIILLLAILFAVPTMVIASYMLGQNAGYRMSRMDAPLPSVKEFVRSVTPEPPPKPVVDEDEIEEQRRMVNLWHKENEPVPEA